MEIHLILDGAVCPLKAQVHSFGVVLDLAMRLESQVVAMVRNAFALL